MFPVALRLPLFTLSARSVIWLLFRLNRQIRPRLRQLRSVLGDCLSVCLSQAARPAYPPAHQLQPHDHVGRALRGGRSELSSDVIPAKID